MRYVANLSILFTELELGQRPAAARAAGFDAVEFWWPFPTATPPADDVDAFVSAIRNAGVDLVALNLFAGDMAAGERGLVSWPERQDEYRDGVHAAARIAERLSCRMFNALYGNRLPNIDPADQDDVALANLEFTADVFRSFGGTPMLEPLSALPAYPLTTARHAFAVIDKLPDPAGVGLLADLYHLAMNGDDIDRLIAADISRITHVQIADAPGRHEPGTGELDIPRWLRALAANGYTGDVAAEYVPADTTVDGLGWLAHYTAAEAS